MYLLPHDDQKTNQKNEISLKLETPPHDGINSTLMELQLKIREMLVLVESYAIMKGLLLQRLLHIIRQKSGHSNIV